MDDSLQPRFEDQIERYRGELRAHCYRMLGSLEDAEDALQESLLAAWRGYDRFEGRSSLRTWLYRITTNACIRYAERRPTRVLPMNHGPAFADVWAVGAWSPELPWLEPCPASLVDAASPSVDPAHRYDLRESLELAFVAVIQRLPPIQRAVLILRDVLAFPAAEVAPMLGLTVASVNSALQRARTAMEQRRPSRSQAQTLADLGEDRVGELVGRLVAAWDAADVPAIVALLTDDVQFGMPPFPAWFDGRDAVARFLTERVFATPWRLMPSTANGQIAFAAYQQTDPGGTFDLSAINVMTLEGDRFSGIMGFLDREVFAAFGFPVTWSDPA